MSGAEIPVAVQRGINGCADLIGIQTVKRTRLGRHRRVPSECSLVGQNRRWTHLVTATAMPRAAVAKARPDSNQPISTGPGAVHLMKRF